MPLSTSLPQASLAAAMVASTTGTYIALSPPNPSATSVPASGDLIRKLNLTGKFTTAITLAPLGLLALHVSSLSYLYPSIPSSILRHGVENGLNADLITCIISQDGWGAELLDPTSLVSRLDECILSPSSPGIWGVYVRDMDAGEAGGTQSEIRLLTLLPGDSNDRTIRCTLKNVTLQIESPRDIQYWRLQESLSMSKTKRALRRLHRLTQPAYEALSYCWGRDEVYDSISINNQFVPVRKGLWMALHQLRNPIGSKSRTLWADAICINQSDLSERSAQVAIMYAIFNRASEVIIWLGEVYDQSNIAMKTIATITKDYSMAGTPEVVPEVDDPFGRYQAILSLYNRPYWSRLWILQEVCLAAKLRVHCGTKSVTWEQFDHFWMNFRRSDVLNEDPSLGISYSIPEGLEKLMDMMHRRTCFSGLLHLLKVSRHLHCWDIRDRVFGLLGLVHQRLGSQPLQADYSTGLQQLYVDVMEWYMKNEPSYGHDVLEMSRVLQDALGRPFQGAPGSADLVHDWKSGPAHVRGELDIMPVDYVQYLGPLLEARRSTDGKFLDLHVVSWNSHWAAPESSSARSFDPQSSEILDSPYLAIYRQSQLENGGILGVLASDGTCCAFVTGTGRLFFGTPNFEVGDRLYCIDKDDSSNLWSLRAIQDYNTTLDDRAEATTIGQAIPWETSEETPFVQQLKRSSLAMILDPRTSSLDFVLSANSLKNN
ncbi:hypothetical protein EG329_013030 [Mollisiaceae sp. DMI_Dod_QoI]|nr:hypothetical protein EG329_013030 [Helotiales sp. DMI_Dod_QoI]